MIARKGEASAREGGGEGVGQDETVAGRERLDQLREGIDEIDREILRLLGERRAVVGRVAEIKRREGMPLYHPAREEDLISARRREAPERALDPDMVEDVFRRVLRSSRETQSQTLAVHAIRPGSRVLVVGGGGAWDAVWRRGSRPRDTGSPCWTGTTGGAWRPWPPVWTWPSCPSPSR